MAEETIAQQLKTLVDAKKSITAAINESAVGTTQQENISKALFSEYGDIIKAIFAVQDIKEGDININDLYTPHKLTCYYIDGTKINSINNQPYGTGTKVNFWLMAASVMRETVLDNVIQVAVRRTQDSALSRLHIRVSTTIVDNEVTEWSNWFEYAPMTELSGTINTTVLPSIEKLTPKTGTTAPATDSDARFKGEIWVDNNQNIYIFDGKQWQLMNSWQ